MDAWGRPWLPPRTAGLTRTDPGVSSPSHGEAHVTTAHRSTDGATRERAQELIRSWDSRPTAGASTLGSLLGRVTPVDQVGVEERVDSLRDRKSTRLNSSHSQISYAVFCLKK